MAKHCLFKDTFWPIHQSEPQTYPYFRCPDNTKSTENCTNDLNPKLPTNNLDQESPKNGKTIKWKNCIANGRSEESERTFVPELHSACATCARRIWPVFRNLVCRFRRGWVSIVGIAWWRARDSACDCIVLLLKLEDFPAHRNNLSPALTPWLLCLLP